MKITSVFLLCIGLTSACGVSFASVVITTFGSNAEADGWSWNPGDNTISGTEVSGALLYGQPLNSDLGSFDRISITAASQTSPNFGFTVNLEDNAGLTATANFSWLAFAGGATVSSVVDFAPGFNKANVVGWTLNSGGSNAAISVTLSNMSATVIPEPSAAVALVGATMLGFAATRRRRRAL